MTIEQYIESISRRYKAGNATEHTYRADLQQLLESLLPGIAATNEPKRQQCGAPDYILTRNDIPVGFIEAKDIGDPDLGGKKKTGNKEQFDRYKASLNNLIFTDYLDFHFYKDGNFVTAVKLGQVVQRPSKTGGLLFSSEIEILPQNVDTFRNLLLNFATQVTQSIKSSRKLAEMMAGKARLLSDVIGKALTSDEENQQDSTLKEQMAAFKQILIHDITPRGFADVYAQTIAYGMFAARLHDPTLPTFSRQEAAELIPKSNPFLRKLFGYIAGPDIDDRIRWIVDSLVDIFLACNVREILQNYGKATRMEDPIIHFYETFLSEYDPALRKARGVWYTPAPVVSFIVRAVHDILKSEFGLRQGLADTSKTKIKVNIQATDKRFKDGVRTVEEEVHKVQILDPATGTGTFLAEVVKQVYKTFEGQQGIWSHYVETQLLPRLNGFELLMASYAMAHLQLDLLLAETGFKPTRDQRFRVFLTNSLEEYHPDTGTLFASWLSSEANEANHIKRDTPVMCVIGNPPYSGISSNNGEWISSLIEDYKYVDGEHFNERKHWLNDDYVKFIRYGQHFIEKNGSGILAFINPHGFLDNPTFRGMRWHLLKTFDKIYTIDLHGNSKKKEKAPDGSADINVFDIQQGVSINIFIKTGKKEKTELGEVFHTDVFGKREEKYGFLNTKQLNEIAFTLLKPVKPYMFFVPKDDKGAALYESGVSLSLLFPVNNVGIVTANDNLNISFSKQSQYDKINDIIKMEENLWRLKYDRKKDAQSWTYYTAREDALVNKNKGLSQISYRPFDLRWTLYTGKSGGLYARPIYQVMRHFLNAGNLGIVLCRQTTDRYWCHVQMTQNIIDNRYHFSYKGIPSIFPLYLYPENTRQQTIKQSSARTPNLNLTIVNQIAKQLKLTFTPEKETTPGTFAPIDILDYIYAVLHSPTYREKYKEFLKIDFPRVPYPRDKKTFWQLVALGGELRQIHLLESPVVEQYITQYPVSGDNLVTKPRFSEGRVFINATQYFENVPEVAWNFFIGGYQPAQKWLKDRKDRNLGYEDILHYQKIIVALTQTHRIMQEINSVKIEG